MDEFELKPLDRVRLYRTKFNLSNREIKKTVWYRVCGRKIMYRTEQDAQAHAENTNSSHKGFHSYECPFQPKTHWHNGHTPQEYNTAGQNIIKVLTSYTAGSSIVP